ncbi:MAG: extracellular solute-binding protein [Lachnospiraceae bacterium]|nr:extracellular solute-binding protein [Lachnospiraceae bacterium]
MLKILYFNNKFPTHYSKKGGIFSLFFQKRVGIWVGRNYRKATKTMKKSILLTILTLFFIFCLSGCKANNKPDTKNPVTLSMWHVYGSQTTSPLNDIIDEFNKTVGKDNGITINVVSVTSSSAIDDALSASANGEPGAADMPDLFIAYPRVAEIVGIDNLLSWNDYFSDNELALFNKTFLEEGFFNDKLLMLPVAKSSEALFINKTLFERFCSKTDITADDLKSFNGLFEVVRKYYDYTKGQNFLQINDYYNYAYIGMKSFGSDFIVDGKLQLDNDIFEKIWTPLAKTAIYGGICLDEGYAASRWKTVEILANTGSTADVLYQPDEVIYSDNTTEPIESLTIPYPTFGNDSSYAIHRGGGLFSIKNEDERKNYAAYIFAKWLTAKDQNLKFVTSSGYMPVTDDALNELFDNTTIVENQSYKNLYDSLAVMNNEYTFYSLPLYSGASDTQLAFEKNVKAVLKAAHNRYIKESANDNSAKLLDNIVANSIDELKKLTSSK